MHPGQVILYLIGIILIIFGAYYATYYISVKSSGMTRGRGRNINLLERFAISKDKGFCIVEICGKVYVIGITNNAMTVLDTLEPEKLDIPGTEDTPPNVYPQYMGGKLQKKIVRHMTAFLARRMGREPPTDFSETSERAQKNTADDAQARTEDFREVLRDTEKDAEMQSENTNKKTSDGPEGEG